ncbi:MAG: hypothetical protein MJZ63_06765 [Muribaculaceae bacterium]|nr:hypothetical protein [Muribaculaceae bacterium]
MKMNTNIYMKKLLNYCSIICACAAMAFSSCNSDNSADVNYKRVIIIRNSGNSLPHLYEPVVVYETTSSIISINFGVQPIGYHTVTISNPYADVDYYATSSVAKFPLVVDGKSDYSISIETAEGNVFQGVLQASEYAYIIEN